MPATVQAAIEARIDRLSHPGQADVERRVGDRRPLRGGAARRAGHRCGVRRAAGRGADRSGSVHPKRRVRVPPSADPRGGLRITAEIRSRPVAPAPGRRDPRACAGVGGGERSADRRTPRTSRRTARGVRLAHARRRVVNQPRSRRGPAQLGAGPPRSPTRCRPTTPTSCRCASPPAPCCVPPTTKARAIQESRGRFAELRELCSAAGDKVSLAIGMSGLATELHIRRSFA